MSSFIATTLPAPSQTGAWQSPASTSEIAVPDVAGAIAQWPPLHTATTQSLSACGQSTTVLHDFVVSPPAESVPFDWQPACATIDTKSAAMAILFMIPLRAETANSKAHATKKSVVESPATRVRIGSFVDT
jgi:hypothetical protein